MIQPSVLATIAANREFRGRGLLARILYAYPTSRWARAIAPRRSPEKIVAALRGRRGDLAAGMAGPGGTPPS